MSGDPLRRVFELADSGRFSSITALRAALSKERLDRVDKHLSGSAIRKQLIARIDAANTKSKG